MRLGYNTNGLAHHGLLDAIELLAAIGYESVAITIDHGALDPGDPRWVDQLDQVASALRRHNMRSVVETGARYLLDPANKHEPTLVSPAVESRQVRVRFLMHAVDIASMLGSDCVSLWSGIVHNKTAEDETWNRLTEELQQVLDHAGTRQVTLGFEPEPGMFIDTVDRFAELVERAGSPRLGLTLDLGHLHCQGEIPIVHAIHDWAKLLVNVHIEDMRAGVHEHLMFGDGEIDFPPAIAALAEIGYRGGLHVELSRHSHVGPTAAMQAATFLRPLIAAC